MTWRIVGPVPAQVLPRFKMFLTTLCLMLETFYLEVTNLNLF